MAGGVARLSLHECGMPASRAARELGGLRAARRYKELRPVQEYMGHASITTTEIYAHFVPRTDAASKGSAGLNAMLAPTGLAREGEIVAA
jgi:integrase